MDPEMPEFLRRWPPDPEKEAAARAAWDARWEFLREQKSTMVNEEENGMVSLVMLHLTEEQLPGLGQIGKLGAGDHKVKLLTLSEKFARVDTPTVGPVMVKREKWDSIKQEKIMDVIQTPAVTNGAETPPPVKEKKTRKAAPVKKAPAAKKAKAPAAKKEVAERDAHGFTVGSNRNLLMTALSKKAGKKVGYAALSQVVAKTDDAPQIMVILKWFVSNFGVVQDGKGKEATWSLPK